MKITNETVYVIYYNDKPYESKNRKIVYTTKGAANSVITTESQEIAKYETLIQYNGKMRWHMIDENTRYNAIEKVKERFKVVEYKPCK